MKIHLKTYLGILILGLSVSLSTQANEKAQVNQISAAELQAAIEAFGVSTAQAKKATAHSAIIIEEQKRAVDKNFMDMLIVSEDFFTLEPL